MSAIKERIFGAVTVMDDVAASKLWNYISDNFSDAEADWDSIPEVEPDEFDLKMLKEIETDPDCQEFISADKIKFSRHEPVEA